MHISERIFSRRSALGLSKAALGKAIGITGVSIGKWESGLNQPKGRYLNDLAAALGVSVNWLLTGTDGVSDTPGEFRLELVNKVDFSNVESAVIPQGRRVPILSYVQAGNWREVCEQATAFDGNLEYVSAGVDIGPCGFGLWVRGDSMTPEFKEGDLVIIDPDEAPRPGDYVVASNGSNEATFKKYRARGEYENGQPRFELVPLNEDHETLSTDQTPIIIIGVMVEHRSYRKRGG